MVSEGIKMCFIYLKKKLYDGLNLELGSGREITAKPVGLLSPTPQISENVFVLLELNILFWDLVQ